MLPPVFVASGDQFDRLDADHSGGNSLNALGPLGQCVWSERIRPIETSGRIVGRAGHPANGSANSRNSDPNERLQHPLQVLASTSAVRTTFSVATSGTATGPIASVADRPRITAKLGGCHGEGKPQSSLSSGRLCQHGQGLQAMRLPSLGGATLRRKPVSRIGLPAETLSPSL